MTPKPKEEPSENQDGVVSPLPQPPPVRKLPQHGVKGAYYGGDWLDIEDCASRFSIPEDESSASNSPLRLRNNASSCSSCPLRSKSRNDASTFSDSVHYDVVIVGAGCVGSSIARELSRYDVSVLLLEAADDVSQGATKGNSGIVHAGYDDKPGSVRAKYCWKGNQMFRQLDRELRFGYQVNGSLVLAFNDNEMEVLQTLKERGETNGVERLRIIDRDEVLALEPAVHPDVLGALLAPDAGNVIPYEFTIALAENAVDNGVEVRIRREVTSITPLSKEGNGDADGTGGADDGDDDGYNYVIEARHWEPADYVQIQREKARRTKVLLAGSFSVQLALLLGGAFLFFTQDEHSGDDSTGGIVASAGCATLLAILTAGGLVYKSLSPLSSSDGARSKSRGRPLADLAEKASLPEGGPGGDQVSVPDMMTGGSGSWDAVRGVTVDVETIKARYVVNCAGGASDRIAKMIGDGSFEIKPRLGDYLLLNRNQGYLTHHTLFPTPDPVLGKGVLVQTTLWGNLILGPTARDTYKASMRDMTARDVQRYILSKCKRLVPYFDARETIHAFCGARAKSSRGDWIVEPSSGHPSFIHVAGIDSPGLAGCPAIAVDVVQMLKEAGLDTSRKNAMFNPNRAPIITPKDGMRGLKMGPVGKNDSRDGTDEKVMAANVICKCEKVTELEVVRALRRSLPIDSTQAIRKRTRAGMGHCQGDNDNYNCECRVKAIIARENGVDLKEVGGRPWPATSTLPERWLNDEEKEELEDLKNLQPK